MTFESWRAVNIERLKWDWGTKSLLDLLLPELYEAYKAGVEDATERAMGILTKAIKEEPNDIVALKLDYMLQKIREKKDKE